MTKGWMKSACGVGLTWVVAVWAPAPAAAVDGVLEIDQACVATGCFPGDSPGFPVEIEVGGSYRLTSDLTVPDDDTTAIFGSGVPGTGEFVSIDLNGFTIRGQYSCTTGNPPTCPGGSARGVDFPAGRAVNLRNGYIRGFGSDAVRLPRNSQVEGLTIDTARGNGIVAGLGSIVRGNVMTGIGEDGIRIVTASVVAVDGLIEGNTVRSTGGDGIEAGIALVLGNLVILSGDESARLSVSAAYGLNKFDDPPTAGASMGNNVCGQGPC